MYETFDDDGFWERLPLDELETVNRTKGQQHDFNVDDNGSSTSSGGFLAKCVTSKLESRSDFTFNETSKFCDPSISSTTTCNNLMTGNKSMNGSFRNAMDKNQGNSNKTSSCSVESHNDSAPTKNCSTPKCRPNRAGTKRKFPGPAGVLPQSYSGDLDKLQTDSPIAVLKDSSNEVFSSSQPPSSCDPFSSKPWQTLLSDVGPDAKSVLDKFSIKAMLVKAGRRELPKGKIPLVLAYMESVEFHGADGSVVLRDPSGKVQGALHYDLIKDPFTALQAGCVVVLRQTSVISPTPRTNYLNITPANIVVIYSQTKGSKVHKAPWSSSPPAINNPSKPFPSLGKIIQDSQQELMATYTTQPNTLSPQIRMNQFPRPFPSLPTPPLFKGVSSTSNITQTHSHSNRFHSPSASSVNNSNRFKTPSVHSRLTPKTSHQSSFTNNNNMSHPLKTLNNSENPINCRPGTTSPMTTNVSHLNRNHTSTIVNSFRNNQQIPPTSCARMPQPSSVLLHQSPASGQQQPTAFNKPLLTNSNFDDEFPDDDNDLLLSLCDDPDQTNVISTEKQQNFSYSNTNQLPTPNTVDVNLVSVPGVSASSSSVATRFMSQTSQDDLFGSSRGCRIEVGGRDSKVQLGVSKPLTGNNLPPNKTEQSYAMWDDDLSDELLSQL